MISASVGFQCPECVREGAKTIRQPKTTLGGKIHDDSGLVTQILIGINVVIFLLVQVEPNEFLDRFVLRAFTGRAGRGRASPRAAGTGCSARRSCISRRCTSCST